MYHPTQFPVLKFIKVALQCYDLVKLHLTPMEHTYHPAAGRHRYVLTAATVTCGRKGFRQAEPEECYQGCGGLGVHWRGWRPSSSTCTHCPSLHPYHDVAVRLI